MKLSDAEVRVIRAFCGPMSVICKQYKLSMKQVERILSREDYGHVIGTPWIEQRARDQRVLRSMYGQPV